jgi:hypothetical protein
MMNEEKLEREIKELIETLSYYFSLGFSQIGKALDLLSFYIHRKDVEKPFQFGQYYVIGFFVILLGCYTILFTPALFPQFEIALIFFSILILGIFLLLS